MYNRNIKSFVCSETEPVVQTKAGKLRGYIVNDVYTFHGIRYAQAERFKFPQPVAPWEGVVDAQDYGYVCPPSHLTNIFGDITAPHRYWLESEHCQYLNVWSTDIGESKKKPVMIWLHGGGWSSGSAIELECYDGENMARYGDVVAVSLNHRLNILGYLDLSEYGEEYALSGIAGLEDMAVALRWVKDNIAQFGGDPDNVTIFGESGGGAKVRALMQLGSADGLYHRASVQSGIMAGDPKVSPEDEKREAMMVAREIVDAAGGLESLIDMPYSGLLSIMEKVSQGRRLNWGPVATTGTYAGEWYNAGFRKETLGIPVIAGSVFAELARYTNLREKSSLSEDERYQALVSEFGAEHADEIKAEFEKAYPGENLYYATIVDTVVRKPTSKFAVERSQVATAPVYNFLFAHETAFKGGLMSTHADELPFVFHNAEYIGAMFNGEQTYKIQDEIFYAWISFARSGNPNHDKLTAWKPVTPDEHNCFVFCRNSETRAAHDEKLTDLVAQYATTRRSFGPPKPESK